MTRTFGYSRVNSKGFAAFWSELERMPWSKIPDPDPLQPLCYAPILVVLKLRLWNAVDEVMVSLGVSNVVADAVNRWKRIQKRLYSKVMYELNSDDAERRASASRVSQTLLMGDGLAQNALSPDQEVDHGIMQLGQCKEGADLYPDIVFLGYLGEIAALRQATERLGQTLGRASLGPRVAPRSVQIQKATRAAGSIFDAVRDSIEHLLTKTTEGTEAHIHVKQLQTSLVKLLERFPGEKTSTENPEPREEPEEEPEEEPKEPPTPEPPPEVVAVPADPQPPIRRGKPRRSKSK